MDEVVFHELSKKEQNDIRRKYKAECSNHYKHSIHLYILYVLVGIVALLGLVVMNFYTIFWGSVIFGISFLLLIFIIRLLNQSNYYFYEFLKENHMIYDKKAYKK